MLLGDLQIVVDIFFLKIRNVSGARRKGQDDKVIIRLHLGEC